MHPLQVVQKYLVVKKVLFAEVAPRMRQDLCALFGTRIAMLNMLSQLLNVVNSLLSNKYRPASQTHFAECLLMHIL